MTCGRCQRRRRASFGAADALFAHRVVKSGLGHSKCRQFVGWVERSETHHLSPKPPAAASLLRFDHSRGYTPARTIRWKDEYGQSCVRSKYPVVDRIEVDVIKVAREILLVTDPVFPIPTLPDAAFALAGTAGRHRLGTSSGREKVVFIRRQRRAKSPLPSGIVQTVCRWSGRTMIASIVNGWRCRA